MSTIEEIHHERDRVETGLPCVPACSHSAESGGFVEVSQQQLSEATSQRGWWETATTAVAMNLLVKTCLGKS